MALLPAQGGDLGLNDQRLAGIGDAMQRHQYKLNCVRPSITKMHLALCVAAFEGALIVRVALMRTTTA